MTEKHKSASEVWLGVKSCLDDAIWPAWKTVLGRMEKDPVKRKTPEALDRIADKVLSHRAAARTKKAKKRQRARRKTQRESSI